MARHRASKGRHFDGLILHPDLVPIVVVVACVVLGNLLALSGIVNEDPINWLSNLAVISHPGFTAGQNTIDPSVGWITQSLGHFAATSLLHGHIPWWDPYEGLGSPLVGEMGSAALFPLTVLDMFGNGHLYGVVILECVAGVATYGLARRLVANRWAAIAAGVAYGLAGTFAWISHAVINPVPFLPVILLGVERAFGRAEEGRRAGWVLIGVGISLAIYGGFPEEVYWFVPFVASWAIVRLVMSWRSGCLLRFARKLGIGVAAGVLLSGPVLVAFLTYLPYAVSPPHVPAYATAAAPAAQLGPQIVPYMYGPIGGLSGYDPTNTVASMWSHTGGYLDTSLLLFAVIGAFGREKRVMRLLLFGVLVVCLARLVGLWPIDEIIGRLPGAWIGFWRYADPVWELSAALLAAFGIDDLIRAGVSNGRLVVGLSAVFAGVGAAYGFGSAALIHLWHAPHGPAWILGSIGWAVGIAAVGALGSRMRGRWRGAIAVGIVAVDACGLYMVPQLASQRNVVNNYSSVSFLRHNLGEQRFVTLGPIAPNYGSYFRVSELNVEDIPISRRWANFVARTLDPGIGGINSSFNFIGTTFWQSPGAPSVEQEVLRHLSAYENAGTKYLIVPASDAGSNDELVAAGMHLVWDAAGVDVFEFPRWAPFYAGGKACKLATSSLTSVTLTCSRPATVIRRELYLPGWRASANGRPLPVALAEPRFQSVRVPTGRSTVKFVFEPPYMLVGWLGLCAGALALIWVWSGSVRGWFKGRAEDRSIRARCVERPDIDEGKAEVVV